MSSKHAETMNCHYACKWRGHEGFWLDQYSPSAQVYALSLYKARNDAIAQATPDGLGCVLEIGCGLGDLLPVLSRKSHHVVGVDIAEVNVCMAQRNVSLCGITNTSLLAGGAESLPFVDGSFDAVVMADVIEHVPNYERAVIEVFRVLRRGGYFLCVTPHAGVQKILTVVDSLGQGMLYPVRRLLGRRLKNSTIELYEHFLSPKAVRTALVQSGLTPLHYRRMCFYPGPEGGGFFASLMAVSYRMVGESGFARLVSWIVKLFAMADRVGFASQKQLWIAKKC